MRTGAYQKVLAYLSPCSGEAVGKLVAKKTRLGTKGVRHGLELAINNIQFHDC
jgi:hypothetical protein